MRRIRSRFRFAGLQVPKTAVQALILGDREDARSTLMTDHPFI
jgi:hypothetical protein